MRKVKKTSITKHFHFAQSPECLWGEIKNSLLSEQKCFRINPSYRECHITEGEMRKIWISKHGKFYTLSTFFESSNSSWVDNAACTRAWKEECARACLEL